MKSIELTQGKTTIVDDEDFEVVSKLKWYARRDKGSNWYAMRNSPRGGQRKTIMLHNFIKTIHGGGLVDHINGDSLDNRKENLRVVTKSQNSMNRKLNKNNRSGIKGVCWSERDKRWVAQIRAGGKYIRLGSFTDKMEAAQVYKSASEVYHGEFARSMAR